MTTTSTAELTRPATTKVPPLKHAYHSCTRDKNPRIAFCGHKSGPAFGIAYSPSIPDVCIVCAELVKSPCAQCEKW